jgi:phage tail tape-measure protein
MKMKRLFVYGLAGFALIATGCMGSEMGGAAGGAALGAATGAGIGMIAGPPGAAAGALIGAGVGGVAGAGVGHAVGQQNSQAGDSQATTDEYIQQNAALQNRVMQEDQRINDQDRQIEQLQNRK